MKASADPGLVKRLSIFASAASLFSTAIGLSVLAGWTFGVADLIAWGLGTPMAPNAAAGTVLAGVSLWLMRKHDQPPTRTGRVVAQSAAAVVAMVGLLTLAEHLFSLSFGIDRLLLRTPLPPQLGQTRVLMSPIAAGHFLLFGLALLLVDWRTRHDDWPAQFVCLGAALAPAFGLLGLILGPKVTDLTLALPAVFSYFLLASGLICSRPTWALGGLLASRSAGARLLRGAVPSAVLVLSLVGWFISKPLLTDSHFTWVEVSVLAVICGGALAGFVAWIAFIVERSDAERQRAETALNIGKEQLDRLMDRTEHPESERRLLRKVHAAFAVALLLTGLLGLLSWHNAQRAAEDADWVAHTHEVSAMLELTLGHLLDVETGGRGFAVTGDERFLEPYKTGRVAVGEDLHRLRRLIVDGDQGRRLEVLAEEAKTQTDLVDELVAARRITQRAPALAVLEQGKRIMDAARITVAEMEARQKSLLLQRSQRARAAQRVSISIIALGSAVGVVFLSIAGVTVSREIGISAGARAQVDALNSDLERRVAERTAALSESEGRLAGMIQSAMDAILTADEQQNIVLFNGAAERMFRCPASEALGRHIAYFIPQRYHAAHEGQVKKFGESGATARAMGALGKLWAVRADGEEFRIEASISHVEAAGKKLFTVILRDITERVQSEAVREHLAAVVNSSDDAIISKDLNGIINAWNRGAEKVFGYSAAEAMGKPMLMLFPPELAAEEPDILGRIRQGGSVEHFETVRVRKDGTRIDVSVTISPVRDSSGAIVGASTIARDITERKRAEEALREQASVLDSAQVFVRDMQSRVVFWPKGAEKLYGFTSQEALGILSHDLFHTKFPEPLEMVEKKLFETGMWEGELIHTRRDGSIIVVSSAWVLHRDSRGQPVRILETNVDITARKQAEERLTGQAEELSRQSEELRRSQSALEAQSTILKLILESMGEGLIAADREGKFIIWNDSAKKLMGRDSAGLPSEQWTQYYRVFLPDGVTPYPPESLPLVRALRGESVQVELMVEQPDHAEGVFLEVTARPMMDAKGSSRGGVAVLRDITEHKRAAAVLARQADELRHSRQELETQTLMLQSVLDSMSEGLVAADGQGALVIWNPAAARILGMGTARLPSQEWTARYGLYLDDMVTHHGLYLGDMVTPFPPDQLPLARAVRGEACTAEMFVRNPELDEGVWIEVKASPLKDRNGAVNGGVAAFRDVTQRRLDEQKIRQLNEELEERVVQRTAQLEAANHELEAFTYSVSHDLRAPLRHIGGFSKILSEDFGPGMPPEAQGHLQRIEDGVGRMGLLVDELLSLARVGRHALHLQATRLNSVIEEVVSLLQPEAQGRAVTWKIANLPSAECDPILIKQVFQNLIANALKFTRTRERAVIEISQRQEDGQMVIAVSDNGVGFNMKYKDKLFGVFQRLHRAEDFEGTGIGLATVQRIIRKHGGRVWAEAELDKGATFFFTLGAVQPTDIQPAEATNKTFAAGAQV